MPLPKGLRVYTIWDEISFLIDSPKDLLSLALTCRTFKELIIPDHLEYRIICCDFRRPDVWKFLASRPWLARRMRAIVIVDCEVSSFTCLPQPFRYTRPLCDSKPVVRENFTWTQKIDHPDFIDISSALRPDLEGLCVNLIGMGLYTEPELETINMLSVWTREHLHLKRVIIRQTTEAAMQMILSCLDIEDLSLSRLSLTSTSYLMRHATLKKMRRLNLELSLSVRPKEGIPPIIISSFFKYHTNIERLAFSSRPPMPVSTLPRSCLPNLRSIAATHKVMTSLLPANIISRLVHWERQDNRDRLPRAIDVPPMDKLESLYLTGRNIILGSITEVLQKAPNLKKLSFDLGPKSGDIGYPGCQSYDLEEIANIFLLPFLKRTHIFLDFG
ncbi:hypothetical protein Clacol_007027 [Clathrus columnatus]|uniref:F-box domain-containing protein n=1 Tax=Clathrus columnatus TaxID=1419009 RepID=A0AAV5ADT4_9AGAM|nr:hypothetical protein Clacol_007027 [Clathrus columnatus]